MLLTNVSIDESNPIWLNVDEVTAIERQVNMIYFYLPGQRLEARLNQVDIDKIRMHFGIHL